MTSLFPLSRLHLHYRNNKLATLAENWKVYSGVVSLDNLPPPYRVKRILLSELYDSKTNDHDVALLKLAAPVVFDGRSKLRFQSPYRFPCSKSMRGPVILHLYT